LFLNLAGHEGHDTASGTISLSGVPAQWFRMYAKGRGQEAIMDQYVLVYNMKGYVISHFTLADRYYDRDKVEAERIIQSFRLLADK
jgi:hypothetical protein